MLIVFESNRVFCSFLTFAMGTSIVKFVDEGHSIVMKVDLGRPTTNIPS